MSMHWLKSTYAGPEKWEHLRDGLFISLWCRFKGLEIPQPEHIQTALWDPFHPTKYYYRIVSQASPGPENLFVIYADPFLCPVYMLEDYFRTLSGIKKDTSKVFIHYLGFELNQHQGYIHSLYQLLHDHLGRVEFLDIPVFLKKSSFKGWSVHTPGLTWFYSDPWIAHYLISKGAYWVQPEFPASVVSKERTKLSPYHQFEILILKEDHRPRFNMFELKGLFTAMSFGRNVYNELNIPDNFLSLAYKNIY